MPKKPSRIYNLKWSQYDEVEALINSDVEANLSYAKAERKNPSSPYYKKSVSDIKDMLRQEYQERDYSEELTENWDYFLESVTEVITKLSPSGYWFVQGHELGWMHRTGYAEFCVDNGDDFIHRIAPHTDDYSVSMSVYYETKSINISFAHHDGWDRMTAYALDNAFEDIEHDMFALIRAMHAYRDKLDKLRVIKYLAVMATDRYLPLRQGRIDRMLLSAYTRFYKKYSKILYFLRADSEPTFGLKFLHTINELREGLEPKLPVDKTIIM